MSVQGEIAIYSRLKSSMLQRIGTKTMKQIKAITIDYVYEKQLFSTRTVGRINK